MMFLGRPAMRMATAGHRGHGHGHGIAAMAPEPEPETQFRVNDALVPGCHMVGDVVYYTVEARGEGGEEWAVEHRYESFRALYGRLDSECYTKTVCDFPPRFWIFSLTKEDIEVRQRELQIWLREVVSILRSEHGPHGATKKEFEKAKVLVNQFLAADSHMKPQPNPVPSVVEERPGLDRGQDSAAEAYVDSSSPATMVHAYPVGPGDKNK